MEQISGETKSNRQSSCSLANIFFRQITLTHVLEGRRSACDYLKEFWGIGIITPESIHAIEIQLGLAISKGFSIDKLIVDLRDTFQYRVNTIYFDVEKAQDEGMFNVYLSRLTHLDRNAKSKTRQYYKLRYLRKALAYTSYQVVNDTLAYLDSLLYQKDDGLKDIVEIFGDHYDEINDLRDHFGELFKVSIENLELVGFKLQDYQFPTSLICQRR